MPMKPNLAALINDNGSMKLNLAASILICSCKINGHWGTGWLSL